MRVLLIQLDGKIPNLALMRASTHFKYLGHDVTLDGRLTPDHWNYKDEYDLVLASAIFKWSRPNIDELLKIFPKAIVGGTGVDEKLTLSDIGITTKQSDYSYWPQFKHSIGFTQRGCRLKCPFCVVPRKEGSVKYDQSVSEIWRGDPWPKELLLLDNDFFGQSGWGKVINDILKHGFKISFNQGINIRFINEVSAAAIASIPYYDDQFKYRRIYTAWDNRRDEKRFRTGLEQLLKAGVAPSHVMVYMLIGYWPGETMDDCDYRRAILRSYGVLPYPMPYVRTRETVGFQRWVITRYDRHVKWKDWVAAGYQSTGLRWS